MKTTNTPYNGKIQSDSTLCTDDNKNTQTSHFLPKKRNEKRKYPSTKADAENVIVALFLFLFVPLLQCQHIFSEQLFFFH